MNKTLRIILMTLLWVFVAAFIVYFNGRAKAHRASTTIRSVDINIIDSTREEMLITSKTIERWIQQNKIATVGVPIEELDLASIENTIRANGFIRRVNAYVSYDGELRIDVSQRRPMLRLMADGYDSYITADGYIFPAPRMSAVYVPVVTGPYAPPVPANFTGRLEDYIQSRIAESEAKILELQHEKVPLFKREKEIKDSVRAVSRMLVAKKGLLSRKGLFESHDEYDKRRQAKLRERAELRQKYSYWNRQNENEIEKVSAKQDAERNKQKNLLKRYEDLSKLINFVKYIEDDSFWSAEIVQIVASTMSSGDLELELIPRTGRHTVLFGEVDDVEEKLDKLLAFYQKGLSNIGWDSFRTISIKYKGQVVCTR